MKQKTRTEVMQGLPAPKSVLGISGTLGAFESIEADLAKRNAPLLEKFDLTERLGGKELTIAHLRNLRQATHVVEGSLFRIDERRESEPERFGGLGKNLPINIYCCRHNLIEPALQGSYFNSDREHVQDALHVLNAWKALQNPKV